MMVNKTTFTNRQILIQISPTQPTFRSQTKYIEDYLWSSQKSSWSRCKDQTRAKEVQRVDDKGIVSQC